MFENVQIPVLAKSREFEPANHNCYDYFLRNTEQYGDYKVFQHYGRDHMRSEFIADIEALAVFFKKELGLKAGDVYTIFMPTNAESMIAFMALNKLGVIVNFVHPLLPPDNLKEIMDFTSTSGIMLLDMFAPKYALTIARQGVPCVICVPSVYAVEDKYGAKANEDAMKAVSACINSYTTYPEIIKKYAGQSVEGVKENKSAVAVYMNGGGTTGKSRTIKLSNDALNNVVYMLGSVNTPVSEVGVDTELCTMPFFHAFGFCAGGLSALHKGSKVVFMPQFDVDKFVALFDINKIVEFNGVPNMYKKLLAHPAFDGPHLKDMKVMYSGGDDIRPAFLEQFRNVMEKNGSSATICQGYGLTECCAVCTVNPPWANKPGTIGKPLPTLRIEIWDEDNKPLPDGEIGQIVITGPTIMEGYLTEDGSIDDGLYKDDEGTKWVLTGDLGYYDEDGYICFVGRIKRIIIISGYNVYPGDIEKLMTELDFIRECCAVQGYIDDKPIVRLFVVLNGDGDKEAYTKRITDLCAERLSKFSVPKEIVFIDELPRTRLQKVDFMSLTQSKAV